MRLCYLVVIMCTYVLFWDLNRFDELLRLCSGVNTQKTAWCSEIGSLTSLDAPELHAASDVREPISLHQATANRKSCSFL